MSYTGVLGNASCTCKLFGGAASIVLSADMLKLSFTNVPPAAYETVFEVISRGRDFLKAEFPENRLAWFALNTSQDVRASGAEIDAYLEQFTHQGAVAVTKQEPEVTYRPSVRVTLKRRDPSWHLHRLVEEGMSNAGDALFITTSLYVSEIAGFDAHGGLERTVAPVVRDGRIGQSGWIGEANDDDSAAPEPRPVHGAASAPRVSRAC